MSLRIEEREGVQIVKLLDPNYIDEALIQKVGVQMMQLVKPEVKIIIDFSGVTFISSALIGKLVLLNKAVGGVHGTWTMHSVCRGIMEPFLITRLNRVFVITKDEKEALAYVNGELHLAH